MQGEIKQKENNGFYEKAEEIAAKIIPFKNAPYVRNPCNNSKA